MERSNQPPKTECCPEKGQAMGATEASKPNNFWEAYTGKIIGRKQDSHPVKAIQLREGAYTQAGTKSPYSEPNTSLTDKGEVRLGLPESKSVACDERADRNLGGPDDSRHTNYECQAGKLIQRQEGLVEGHSDLS